MHSEATILPNRILFQTASTRKYLSVCVSFRFFYLSIPLDHLYNGLLILHQSHYWKPDHKWHQLISTEVSPPFLAPSPDPLSLNKNILSYGVFQGPRWSLEEPPGMVFLLPLSIGLLSGDFFFSENLNKSGVQGIIESQILVFKRHMVLFSLCTPSLDSKPWASEPPGIGKILAEKSAASGKPMQCSKSLASSLHWSSLRFFHPKVDVSSGNEISSSCQLWR